MADLASHLRAWIARTEPDEPMRRFPFGRGMAQRDRELLREIEAWELLQRERS